MRTKISSVGSSRAVVIPAQVARDLGWEVGQEVEIQPMSHGVAVLDREAAASMVPAARRFMRRNADLFRKLADR